MLLLRGMTTRYLMTAPFSRKRLISSEGSLEPRKSPCPFSAEACPAPCQGSRQSSRRCRAAPRAPRRLAGCPVPSATGASNCHRMAGGQSRTCALQPAWRPAPAIGPRPATGGGRQRPRREPAAVRVLEEDSEGAPRTTASVDWAQAGAAATRGELWSAAASGQPAAGRRRVPAAAVALLRRRPVGAPAGDSGGRQSGDMCRPRLPSRARASPISARRVPAT